MFRTASGIMETTTTTGTGTLTLGGAVTAYRAFTELVGFVTSYRVYECDADGVPTGVYEEGIGTVGSGTLSRDVVTHSSNSDALVTLASGTKRVICAELAEAPRRDYYTDGTLIDLTDVNPGSLVHTEGVYYASPPIQCPLIADQPPVGTTYEIIAEPESGSAGIRVFKADGSTGGNLSDLSGVPLWGRLVFIGTTANYTNGWMFFAFGGSSFITTVFENADP